MDKTVLIPSKRVLVVDDDDSIRDLCALVLRTAGYWVDTAVHGGDGLARLSGAAYALVISDVNMPELGGIEFYDIASASDPDLSFLIMTADASDEVQSAVSGRGLKCLEKPFRIVELLEAVEELMAGRLKTALRTPEAGGRKEGRLCFSDACALVSSSGAAAAVARDISPHGMRAAYPGKAIPAGESVRVKVSLHGLSFERGGRAVWTGEGEGDGAFVSGIEFVEPMPVSSIIGIMPGRF